MQYIIDKYFCDNEYHTKPKIPRTKVGRWYKIKTRWYFTIELFRILFRNRKKAVKGIYDRKAWVYSSLDIFDFLETCGGQFHISGIDNIRNLDEPVVFISNHMSTTETMIFPGLIAAFRQVTFVVKDSLVKHFLFGPVMRARKPIVVSRENSREDLMNVMKTGQQMLKDGISVVIFPQSTRMVNFKPEEFNSLGVKLAASAGAKVVPMAIKTDFWGNGKYVKEFGKLDRNKPMYIHVGEPMEVSKPGKKENDQIIEFIQFHMAKWKDDR